MRFCALSAVWDGIQKVKDIIIDLNKTPLFGQKVVLFIDEIHRFNKLQQDLFLPFVEQGTIILIGATAENPSFYLNSALLSRLHVLELYSLDDTALLDIFHRYESLRKKLPITERAKQALIKMAQGDGKGIS